MNRKKQPQLFDMVALLNPDENFGLEAGDVGTVVDLLPPDAVEVEFLERTGRTRCVVPLKIEDLLVLNRQRSPVE